MAGDLSAMPRVARLGTRATGSTGVLPRLLPRAPRSTSAETSPAFSTIERVNPDEPCSGSISATYPRLRVLSNPKTCPFADGALPQADSIDARPPRTLRTMRFGLAYASATTAEAPALTKPAAKLSTRCLADASEPPGSRGSLLPDA